ncbi:hypothetical protein LSM04_004966 [Trypanosoma melophagium]|uniref:uncharacterized protein n=1 Tax=Trypanosoma melophagium TaxID=715481 RepID=UPI00351AA936|nr:hypothetical protein LSM04_004966 [Trypanosoma melophagium]
MCPTGQSEVPVRYAMLRWCLLVVPEMMRGVWRSPDLTASFPATVLPHVMILLTECTFFDARCAKKKPAEANQCLAGADTVQELLE